MSQPSNYFSDKDVMYLSQSLAFIGTEKIEIRDFYLLKITSVCYDEQAPKKEALENVLSSLKMEGINFIFLIIGRGEKVDFYYGISKDLNYKQELNFAIRDIGNYILKPSIQGNFRGSRVKVLGNDEKRDILDTIASMPEVGIIEGVPGANKDDEKYQGIDRLVNVMYGDSYCFLVVAKPLNNEAILQIQENLYKFYDSNAPLAKLSIQTGKGSQKGTSDSATKGTSETTGKSDTKSTSKGTSASNTHTQGKSSGESHSQTSGSSTTRGDSGSTTNSSSESKSTTHTEGSSEGTTKGTNESGGSKSTSKSGSKGTNESKAKQEGTTTSNSQTLGTSHSNSKSQSSTDGTNKGTNESTSHQQGTSSSASTTVGTSTSSAASESITKGTNKGTSESNTSTVEYINRKIQDFLKFMDDVVFPRLDYGKGKGTFLTSMCVFASEPTSLQKIKNTVTALYSGEAGNKIPLQSFAIGSAAREAFNSFQLPSGTYQDEEEEKYLTHFAMHHLLDKKHTSCLGNWITTNELGMIAGLPQKEVVGLSLNEEVEFGLNFEKPQDVGNSIELGHLIQNGNELEKSSVYLDKNDLDKHIFVTGVTGSGKTTTCQTILNEADMPFLVIEPAKTEYRVMLKKHPDLMVFTLGNNQATPLKMNPLVFYKHESITSRVDMLCACIQSAFDMEAAIPQIIEQALYESYKEKDWDVYTNKNSKYPDPFSGSGEAFPTISDVIRNCQKVVNNQGFDDRLKRDYIGSINARLLGLTSGGKGVLLGAQSSIDFIDLLDRKVVFELENIRSSAEKALVMGFILVNLSEAIREKYKETGRVRHITLVEEAHRLLSKYVVGDNPSKKHVIEMFSDMLAEIRKYGESLIIVDQIPNKLTSDVLKNTNTKIIHRIFAADDKEAIGNTVMLKEDQKDFLSNLPSGRAVYFTTSTEKAIQIKIKSSTNTSDLAPSDDEIRGSVIGYYLDNFSRGLYMGLELFESRPTFEQFKCLRSLNDGLVSDWTLELNQNQGILSEETAQNIKKVADLLGNVFVNYISTYHQESSPYKYVTRHF